MTVAIAPVQPRLCSLRRITAMAVILRNTFHMSCLITNLSPNITGLILLQNFLPITLLITICHTTQDYRHVAILHLKEPIPEKTTWKCNCKKPPSRVSHTPMSMGRQGLVVQQRAKRRNITNPWSLRRHITSTGLRTLLFEWTWIFLMSSLGKGCCAFCFSVHDTRGALDFLHFNLLGRVVYLYMPSFLYIRTNVKSSNYNCLIL
jgi:hypothetical protein